MIVLRQGKAKNILENSINSALTAVETYNRPRVQFRIENYIILMIIAWTKLTSIPIANISKQIYNN